MAESISYLGAGGEMFRLYTSLICAVSVVLALAGCGATANLTPGTHKMGAKEAVVIIGLKNDIRIQVHDGPDQGTSGWRIPVAGFPVINKGPDSGYIVVKLAASKPRRSYGVTRVMEPGWNGQGFVNCANSQTPTFKLQAGTLTYIGDFVYEQDDTGLSFRLEVNVKEAREFVEDKYPSLVTRFEALPAQLKTVVNGDCTPNTIIVPIVVPT